MVSKKCTYVDDFCTESIPTLQYKLEWQAFFSKLERIPVVFSPELTIL